MTMAIRYVDYVRKKAKAKRKAIFKSNFDIDENTIILDLGSNDGSNIFNVLKGERYNSSNVVIADIDWDCVCEGCRKYGFTPVMIQEDNNVPFADGSFDIVYCSSVIEHVTVAKELV